MFLINEPHHKRWMLPDGIHAVNCVIHGDKQMNSIINVRTNKMLESYTFNVSRTDLHEQFCALAERKYRKQPAAHHRNNPVHM